MKLYENSLGISEPSWVWLFLKECYITYEPPPKRKTHEIETGKKCLKKNVQNIRCHTSWFQIVHMCIEQPSPQKPSKKDICN